MQANNTRREKLSAAADQSRVCDLVVIFIQQFKMIFDVYMLLNAYRVPTPSGKSWKVLYFFPPGPGRSWEMSLVLKSPGNYFKVLESPGIYLWFKLYNRRSVNRVTDVSWIITFPTDVSSTRPVRGSQ